MSEQLVSRSINFDQRSTGFDVDQAARIVLETCLTLGGISMEMAAEERKPRYVPMKRENNSEHSYMLALAAPDIAETLFPELNDGLVSRFAIVHDLIEIETGDVATFGISDNDLMTKEKTEQAAIARLVNRLPESTARMVIAYEKQVIDEARFVRMLDKLMPLIADILGPGSQVMHEDYGVLERDQLANIEDSMQRRFEAMFPENNMTTLHLARRALADIFIEQFEPAPRLQSSLF